jgi:NitT/TauT family transport system substrate-binding protein
VRVGYFPNINHAQALIGQARRWFEPRLGTRVEWKAFNAGPSAMEALLVGAIDLSYVGPNPAVNAYVRSQGAALRIVAGAASGGAALVVRRGAGIQAASDLQRKRIAAPELGNTQDVALRHWLTVQGLQPGQSVKVLSMKNADIMTLFQRKELDAAWVPEPWVTRLLQEADGALLLDERDLWPEQKFPTAVLVVRSAFLREHRDTVKRWIEAHVELTEWIAAHPDEAKTLLNGVLAHVTGQPLPTHVLSEAFARLEITSDPVPTALLRAAHWARTLGYLPTQKSHPTDLNSLFELSLLNDILQQRGKAPIPWPSGQEEER